jgi:hypothetical protein
MLVALMNAGWDLDIAIKPFLYDAREKCGEHNVGAPLMRESMKLYRAGRHYDACAMALEARAIVLGLEEPGRAELVGRVLCAAIREFHPFAPPGFERVGRMRNPDRPRDEDRLTPMPPPSSFDD